MAIGINTLVLILLAIVTLAVMIYLITQSGSSPQLDCYSCKVEFSEYCRRCFSSKCSGIKISDYNDKLCDCLNKCGLVCSRSDLTCQDSEVIAKCSAVGINYGELC